MTPFTKVPNDFLDRVATLSPSAVKLALVLYRHTAGYQRDNVRMSLRQAQELTGLSRQGVLDAADAVTDFFNRSADPSGTVWSIRRVDGVVNSVDRVVNSVDRGGQLSRPLVVNSVDRGGQLSRPITSGLKKVIKENNKDHNKESENHHFFTLYNREIAMNHFEFDEAKADATKRILSRFTELTDCWPRRGDAGARELTTEWIPEVYRWIDTYGDVETVLHRLERAVQIANGDNELGRTYTVSSPASLSRIMQNMPAGDVRTRKLSDINEGGFYA